MVAKSLVVADIAATVRYRLHETTRVYAIERLIESGEYEQVAQRHAAYYRDLLERAEVKSEEDSTVKCISDYCSEVDDVRGALDWAFSPTGDVMIGLALPVESGRLWFDLSLQQKRRMR